MSKPPRYLKQLEHELLTLGDDAMLLEELDGFIAGLLICPDLIKPSEWLPVVWGSEEEDEPAFDNLDHLNRVLGLVMGNPPVRAAGQAGRGFLGEGFLSQRFARAATSALSRSASKALGLKSSPGRSRVSAWRSWPGSSSASSISP